MNLNIPNQEMLVIDAEGNKLGVMGRDAALRIAHEKNLDLIEIASQAKPPVAKILDYQKFKYEESKKEQIAKRNAKDVELKEIWLSPRIAEHDLQTRLRRAEEFLHDGHKILFRVKFKGREMAHLEFGFNLIKKIQEGFGDRIVTERDPKLEGRSITVIIGRGKGGHEKKVEATPSVISNTVERSAGSS